MTASKKKNYFHERFNDAIYVISNQIAIAIRISQLLEEIQAINQGLEQKVTERTAELEEKTRQLIAAERLAAVGEMSNRVAHDLRNSLTVVGGLARRLHENRLRMTVIQSTSRSFSKRSKPWKRKVSNLIKLGAGEEIRVSKKEAPA